MTSLDDFFLAAFSAFIQGTTWFERLKDEARESLQFSIVGIEPRTLKGYFSDITSPVVVAEARTATEAYRFVAIPAANPMFCIDDTFTAGPIAV